VAVGDDVWGQVQLLGVLFLPTVECSLMNVDVLAHDNFSVSFSSLQSVLVKWSIPGPGGGRARTWLRESGFEALLIGRTRASYSPGSVKEWRAHASLVESWICVLVRIESLRVSSADSLERAIRAAASARAGENLNIPHAPLVVGSPGQASLQVLKANESVFRNLLIHFNIAVVQGVLPRLRARIKTQEQLLRAEFTQRYAALGVAPDPKFKLHSPFVYLSDGEFWGAVDSVWDRLRDLVCLLVGGGVDVRGRVGRGWGGGFSRHFVECRGSNSLIRNGPLEKQCVDER
jgi:hypothetical protein